MSKVIIIIILIWNNSVGNLQANKVASQITFGYEAIVDTSETSPKQFKVITIKHFSHRNHLEKYKGKRSCCGSTSDRRTREHCPRILQMFVCFDCVDKYYVRYDKLVHDQFIVNIYTDDFFYFSLILKTGRVSHYCFLFIYNFKI